MKIKFVLTTAFLTLLFNVQGYSQGAMLQKAGKVLIKVLSKRPSLPIKPQPCYCAFLQPKPTLVYTPVFKPTPSPKSTYSFSLKEVSGTIKPIFRGLRQYEKQKEEEEAEKKRKAGTIYSR
jgi:hypothetical protein